MDPAFHVSIMSLKNQQKARRSVANDDHWKKTTSLRNGPNYFPSVENVEFRKQNSSPKIEKNMTCWKMVFGS